MKKTTTLLILFSIAVFAASEKDFHGEWKIANAASVARTTDLGGKNFLSLILEENGKCHYGTPEYLHTTLSAKYSDFEIQRLAEMNASDGNWDFSCVKWQFNGKSITIRGGKEDFFFQGELKGGGLVISKTLSLSGTLSANSKTVPFARVRTLNEYKKENEKAFKERMSDDSVGVRVNRKTFTDSRDGRKYNYVKIGSQTWMSDYMEYKIKGGEKPKTSGKKNLIEGMDLDSALAEGGLYTLDQALKVCPSGWRLPTVQEFDALVSFAGGKDMTYKLRTNKEIVWLKEEKKATNEFGFGAVPAGFMLNDAEMFTALASSQGAVMVMQQTGGIPYNFFGGAAFFWTSSKNDKTKSNMIYMITSISAKATDAKELLKPYLKDEAAGEYTNTMVLPIRCIFGGKDEKELEPKSEAPVISSFKDSRNGKEYKTAKISKQMWMAGNLNFDAKGSECYDNKPANCEKYGRLYDWKTAKMACPKGWHLPSDAEWTELTGYIGTAAIAGKKLKAKSGWDDSGNGTDDFGFSAMPGGVGSSDGKFYYAGGGGFWWSSTESDAASAHSRFMDATANVGKNEDEKTFLYSVRCVKD